MASLEQSNEVYLTSLTSKVRYGGSLSDRSLQVNYNEAWILMIVLLKNLRFETRGNRIYSF
jgi:hypothetical protein